MFYIYKVRSLSRRDALTIYTIPSAVVFLVLCVLTAIMWGSARAAVHDERADSTQRKNSETAIYIQQRMDAYEDILRGAAGLVNTGGTVNRAAWHAYLSAYDIGTRYPGVQGVGYAALVPGASASSFTDRVRATDWPKYTLSPQGDRSQYAAVLYIEPMNDKTAKAIGYDMYSDVIRREAMDQARDTGAITMTGTVKLLSEEDGNEQQPGFIVYMPVYSSGSVPDTLEARREQIKGFVYAPFRTYDLINKTVTAARDQNYAFRVYADRNNEQELLFESSRYADLIGGADQERLTNAIAIAGSTWEIAGVTGPGVVSSNIRDRPALIATSGFLTSLFVALVLFRFLSNRAKALAQKEERVIRAAKDELLSLASHQLRTPATGVKQYVGMIREGFAGPVSDTQKMLLDKAYESNERQLITINEMLFVARADAGHLRMESYPFDVNGMVRDVCDEQQSVFTKNMQVLRVSLARKPLRICGDKHYVRMAVENIVNNASKYTKSGGKISVRVSRTREREARIVVKDTGVGVTAEQMQLLFQKFSRVPNELTNEVVGSGMGLYLAKQIIETHNGAITFDSVPGKGSTVTITIPLCEETAKSKTSPKRPRRKRPTV